MTDSNRTTHVVSLAPVAGSRFQPTGFPDLGAATFQRPTQSGWVEALLVESVQSMANRLEATTWDDANQGPVPAVQQLPYVQVVDPDGVVLTSSRVEAHRLASAYIMEGTIETDDRNVEVAKWLPTLLGLAKGRPLDHHTFVRTVFDLDPLSLVHGVFFAQKSWPWQPKVSRAVTCFIEAHEVRPAVSGGVKKDSVVNTVAAGDTVRGYGMVPHQRTEYTAREVVAFITIDHGQIRAYGLSQARTELLEALIDFEVSTLFSTSLRLRTACDLDVVSAEPPLPDVDAATARLTLAIAAVSSELQPVRTVVSGRSS